MYQAPLYEAGSVVYLKESAILGFIESYVIDNVGRSGNGDGWIYTIQVSPARPASAPHYGERRSLVNGATMFFKECEFVSIHDALLLAEAYLKEQLSAIQAQINITCVRPESDTNDNQQQQQ